MSRKSDIELVSGFRTIREIADAAYDLGRAAQAEKDSAVVQVCGYFNTFRHLSNFAKCLRAKVRKQTGETK